MVAAVAEALDTTPQPKASADHGHAPLIEALRRHELKDVAPFAAPGHKGGAGASDEARALLGDGVFAAPFFLAGPIAPVRLDGAGLVLPGVWFATTERRFRRPVLPRLSVQPVPVPVG